MKLIRLIEIKLQEIRPLLIAAVCILPLYNMSTESRCRVRTVCKKMLMACMLVASGIQFQIVLVQLTAAFTCHVDIFYHQASQTSN